ncbi:MAG: long-chain fatty acid--CoA ligase [Acetobacteraceae bacterium]|nr:long-chain fatty acid--CoA ligase [Acetobacteraceae bacterium]
MKSPIGPAHHALNRTVAEASDAAEVSAMGAQAVARWARATSDAVAVVEGEASWSYKTLAANIGQAAEMLRMRGLQPGMIFGIQCDIQYLHLILMLAAEAAGAVQFSMAPSDLMFDSELSDRCDLICVEAMTAPLADHPRAILLSRDTIGELARIEVAGDGIAALSADWPPGEIIRIATTSGTTGARKFVCYTRRALQNAGNGIEHILDGRRERYDFVSFYRFNLMGTYSHAMLALTHGKSIFFCTDTDFLPVIRARQACHTMLVVGDVHRVAAEAARLPRRADSCSIRVLGAALPPRLRAALRASLTNDIVSTYSSNETRFISIVGDDGVGTLFPDISVRIVDDDGNPRNMGEPGTIMVRSPRMGSHYLWNDGETRKHFIDGWFRINDAGVMPEPGKLIVLGRTDDMINTGGIKLAPYPIEERIRVVEGVSDAILMSHTGESGVAELHVFIERDDPAFDEGIGQALVTLLRRHVTTFAAHYATRFPRTQTGKVRRNVLRDRLSQGE